MALNPETGTTIRGGSIEEALVYLQEATALYIEKFPVASFGKPLLTAFEVLVRRLVRDDIATDTEMRNHA